MDSEANKKGYRIETTLRIDIDTNEVGDIAQRQHRNESEINKDGISKENLIIFSFGIP